MQGDEDMSFLAKRERARALESSIFHESDPSSHIHTEEFGEAYRDVEAHGYLLKKAKFYTHIRMSSRIWQKRWFMLGEQFTYCRDPFDTEKNKRIIPLTKATEVSFVYLLVIEVKI